MEAAGVFIRSGLSNGSFISTRHHLHDFSVTFSSAGIGGPFDLLATPLWYKQHSSWIARSFHYSADPNNVQTHGESQAIHITHQPIGAKFAVFLLVTRRLVCERRHSYLHERNLISLCKNKRPL